MGPAQKWFCPLVRLAIRLEMCLSFNSYFDNWALLARVDDSVATSECPAMECWSSGVFTGQEGERKNSDGGALERGYRGV